MELLTFPLLALEFIKHQSDLANMGISAELKIAGNMFEDGLLLSKSNAGKSYQFLVRHRPWERYREFSVNLGSPLVGNLGAGASWYHFRLNPVTGQPIQVQYSNGSFGSSSNPWLSRDFPLELREFAEEILGMINNLIEKIQVDKVSLDSSEVQ